MVRKIAIYCLVFLLINLISIQFIENAYAERVHGKGAINVGADYYRTYNYPDSTVKVPLGNSWIYDRVYDAPIEKGMVLTNYRLYFGDGRDIVAINNQTGTDLVTSSYKVGNPFIKSFPSSYGDVTSAVEGYRENSSSVGNSLFFGTSNGKIGKLTGYGLDDAQDDQEIQFSGTMNSEPINHFGYVSSGDYLAAASETLIRMIDTNSMSLKWTGGIDGGGTISGMTALSSSDLLVTTDHGLNKGYGYIYDHAIRNSGYGIKPTKTINYFAGIPRAPTFDRESNLIYSVDKEGRIYQHDTAGELVNIAYVGDAPTRGYESIGGSATDENYVYASTFKSSVSSSYGTISRHSKSDIGSKKTYVHNAPVTTTPILLSGLLYFGDANGRVYALDPSTMEKVEWYLDETMMTPRDYFDIGARVETLIGADNHLIAANNDKIAGFKGRPDFYIADQSVNNDAAQGARVNFYSDTMPSISLRSEIGNAGTFDYDIYTDFNGTNSQQSKFEITNKDSNTSIPLFNETYTNNAGSDYWDELMPQDKTKFQVPVNRSFNISNSFIPNSEGQFSFKTTADVGDIQKEFDNFGANEKISNFDVVDMRNPTALAKYSVINRGDTNEFNLSITQKYSQRSYVFEVRYPNGSDAMYKSGNGTPPSTLTMEISDNAPRGNYEYRLRIKNKFNEWLYSPWKSFDVVNIPPSAGFTTNKMSFVRGENVQITSTASDPDGDSLTHSYVITSPTGIKSYSSSINPSFKVTELGRYSISQTVNDGAGGTDSYSSSINVLNRAPNAGFNTDKSTYYDDQSIRVTSTASDPDGDSLAHTYTVTRPDGSKYNTTQTNPTISSLQKGTYTIRQVVSDGNGGSDAFSKSVTVLNRGPQAGFDTNKPSYYDDETIKVTSTATDPDGDSLTHKYTITRPDGTKYTTNTTNPSITSLQKGTYTIKQVVNDGNGGSDTVTKTVKVVNRGPKAGFNTDKPSYYNEQSIKITSTATDPDGDTLTHTYTITRPDGSKYSTNTVNPTISNPLQKGKYTINQVVTDGNGGSDSVTKSVDVGNRGPKAGFTTNKTDYLDNEKVYVTSTATDPDGDPLTYLYKITRPNGTTFTLTNENPNFGSLVPGTYKIEQTVKDTSGATDYFARTVSVTSANRPPTAGFNFDKSKYYKGESIRITSTATDPDGDSLNHVYQITRPDGSKFTSNQINPSFTATQTGTYIVRQTVTDPSGLSDSMTKSQWVQTLPTPGFSTNKTSFYRGETVRVTTSAFDEDGGTVNHVYELTAPNGQKSTYTSANPTFSVNQLGKYTIKQTVTDDEGDKANTSKEITVLNRGPAAGFNLNKSKYYKGETIAITSSAFDADGDPLSYSYEITKPNGQTITSSLRNPSFIANVSGTYTIKQTVADPYGLKDSVTHTQWVQTLPTPGFDTDKTSYVRGDTMKITSSAFDEDGGNLTYRYEVVAPNGSKQTSTAENPSFTVTQLGEYIIKQTVTDDEGDQASISKKVNVLNQPPTAGFKLDKVKYYKNETINIRSTATDPDGDVLTYNYEITRPNGTKFNSSAVNPSFKATETGTYTIKQVVRDPKGASDTFSKSQWVQTLPTPGFLTDKGIYVRGETVEVTNKAFDEDGGTVIVSYEITAPDKTKKTYNEPNPDFEVEQNGDYIIKQTVTDDEGDQATVTKKINVVNQPPEAGFETDATEYFIGDTVKVTNTATDPDKDPLTFKYVVTKPNGSTFTKTIKDFTFKTDQLGEYTIKQTVTDSFDATDTETKKVLVKDLVITGIVKHTDKWNEKHAALGNAPNEFYSGETFVLDAEITNYPANYVRVKFEGKQVSGNNMLLFASLAKQSNELYTGDLYDPEMSEPDTRLASGVVNFDFEVEYINGTVRTTTVPIMILGSAYDSLQMHQSH